MNKEKQSSDYKLAGKVSEKSYAKRGAANSLAKTNGAGEIKGSAKEADRIAKRKTLTLKVFNAVHDSRRQR